MHSMLRQHQIRAQDIKPYVRTYDRKNPVGADEWATQEGMIYGPGMLIFVLEPAKRPPGLTSFAKPQADAAPDLFRVKDLSCVVDKIENKSWVLNITPSAYELRFLDTLFREKAKKAIFDGLDLNFLIAKPRQELTENQLKELRQIANSYSDGGSRRSLVQDGAELEEPTRAILNFLGVDWSSQPNKQVIEIGTICHMLFAPDPGQEDPLRQSIRSYFTAVMSSESLLSEGIPQVAVASTPVAQAAPTPAKATYSFTQPEDYIEPEPEPDYSQFESGSEAEGESDFDMSDLDLDIDLDAEMAPLQDSFPMATQEFGRPAIGGDSDNMETESEIPSLPSWYLTTHDVQEMNSHARSLFALARSTSAKSQNGDTPASEQKVDFSAQFINDYEQGLAGAEDSEVQQTPVELQVTEEPGPEYSESIFADTGARGSLETNPEASTAIATPPPQEIAEPESSPSQDWDPVVGEDLPETNSDSSFDAMQEIVPPQEKTESASLLSRLTGAVGQDALPEVAEPVKDPLKPPTNLKEMLTADSEVFRVSKPASSPAASAQEIFAQSSDSNAALNQVPDEQAPTPLIEPNFNIEIETPLELTSMEMSVPDFSNIANEFALEPLVQEPEQSPDFFESPINTTQEESNDVFQDEWSSSDAALESEAEPVEFAPAREIEERESEGAEEVEDVYEDSPAVPWEVAPPEEEPVEEESMLMPPPGLFQPDDTDVEPTTSDIEIPATQAIITPPPPRAPEPETLSIPLPVPEPVMAAPEPVAAEIEPEPELELEPEPEPEPEPEFEQEPERAPIVTPPPKPTTTSTPIPSRLASLAAPTGTVSSTNVPALTPQIVAQSQANPAPAPAPAPPPMPQASAAPLHNVEPKLMISESTRFIAKLNQRIVEAESKLSSKSDQAKERLNKLLTEFVDEAEKLEKQREQNSMNLTAKATKNLERVAEHLKSLIQETASQAITEIDDISSNSAGEITQLNQEILATLKSADQRVKIDSDTAVELTHQKLEGHVEKRLDEYQAQNALQQLESTNEEFSARLDERFSRFEVRIKQEIQSILSSLERNVGSMNEEIEGSWDRASEKLLIGRADFERTVNHLVRDCELIIEQRTKLAYIEKILPKLLDNKDIFRTMLSDMKKNFEEQADQTISAHIEGLERNISSAKETLERVVEQCVVELDEIGNSQQKDIENLFDTYNDRLTEMHTMAKIKIGEARKKIEENEEVCTRVREYARTEEDPVLSKERAKTRTMLSDVRNQSEQTLEATIQTYCQTMEDLSESLQSELSAKRNDWTHQVKQSSEDGLAQIKQAIADAYQAIEIAKEKYME